MAKRYGRNQKRRHLAEIAQLESYITRVERKATYAEFRAENARDEAFNDFIKQGDIYKYALGECAYGVGRGLAEQLNEHRDKVLGMVVKEPMKFSYSVRPGMHGEEQKIVRVVLPLRTVEYAKVVL